MKVLAIDAGNTRVKWGLHDGVRWRKRGWIASGRAQELKSALAGFCVPHAVVVANVGGTALHTKILRALAGRPAPRFIKSQRAQCGVRSSYRTPVQLGCDRWAALIGAYQLHGGPALVVNAGTALTVDALTADGVFVGGVIVPGTQLMRKALAENTAALKLQPGKFSFFPNTTGDAIVSGAIDALAGATERMARFLEDTSGTVPICVVSGGNAALLAPRLNLEVKVVDNLVLEGLLLIACEIN